MATGADSAQIPALTVMQPWGWAIATQGKAVENRGWRTAYRGPLAIHGGQAYDEAARMPGHAAARLRALEAECRAAGGRTPEARHLALGAVLAVAELTGCHQDQPGSQCSEWAADGQWHWQLEDVRPLPEPVPCRGSRQLWAMPPQVAAAVQDQLGASLAEASPAEGSTASRTLADFAAERAGSAWQAGQPRPGRTPQPPVQGPRSQPQRPVADTRGPDTRGRRSGRARHHAPGPPGPRRDPARRPCTRPAQGAQPPGRGPRADRC